MYYCFQLSLSTHVLEHIQIKDDFIQNQINLTDQVNLVNFSSFPIASL